MPVKLTVLLVASPPLTVTRPLILPATFAVQVTFTVAPLAFAPNVVGVIVKSACESVDATVKDISPVKSVPVTVNDNVLVDPASILPKSNDVLETEIVGITHVPETLTAADTPSLLRVMAPLWLPVAVGL